MLAAVDARVGVVANMIYSKGTTHEVFYAFIKHLLIPKLEGTGRRVITMNRLGAHYGDCVEALREAGHLVVFRPVHSPTFGPVEWVFSGMDKFSLEHTLQVHRSNLRESLEAAFLCVTKFDIESYMSEAHFFVPGHEYKPYLGEQV